MPIIHAQKIPQKIQNSSDLLARFCYHFPHYSYQQARKLPYKRVLQMLKVARKEQAWVLYNLTQIASAPHSKKGSGVTKMLKYFQEIIQE